MTTAKKFLSVLALCMALALVPLAGCAGQDGQGQSGQSSSQAQSQASSSAGESEAADGHIDVTLQIDASAAQQGGVDTSAIGDIAGPATYQLTEDATAYDALVATGAELDGSPSYVTSINGISEGADGKSSGWMYEVNGEAPTVAANECVLQNGDSVRWYFSSWD